MILALRCTLPGDCRCDECKVVLEAPPKEFLDSIAVLRELAARYIMHMPHGVAVIGIGHAGEA